MEAVPLSNTSTTACTKALTFFGFPVLAYSKRSLRIVARNLLQTFGINCARCLTSHTAYHPESNGAVERLHRRLKDTLRARATVVTWSEELPFDLLRLWAQPREDTGLSLAEAVFGAPIVLPNKFVQNEEIYFDSIIKSFS
jgi:hypothetical protein